MTKINMTNFGHINNDPQLTTPDRQSKNGHLYADFVHFFGH